MIRISSLLLSKTSTTTCLSNLSLSTLGSSHRGIRSPLHQHHSHHYDLASLSFSTTSTTTDTQTPKNHSSGNTNKIKVVDSTNNNVYYKKNDIVPVLESYDNIVLKYNGFKNDNTKGLFNEYLVKNLTKIDTVNQEMKLLIKNGYTFDIVKEDNGEELMRIILNRYKSIQRSGAGTGYSFRKFIEFIDLLSTLLINNNQLEYTTKLYRSLMESINNSGEDYSSLPLLKPLQKILIEKTIEAYPNLPNATYLISLDQFDYLQSFHYSKVLIPHYYSNQNRSQTAGQLLYAIDQLASNLLNNDNNNNSNKNQNSNQNSNQDIEQEGKINQLFTTDDKEILSKLHYLVVSCEVKAIQQRSDTNMISEIENVLKTKASVEIQNMITNNVILLYLLLDRYEMALHWYNRRVSSYGIPPDTLTVFLFLQYTVFGDSTNSKEERFYWNGLIQNHSILFNNTNPINQHIKRTNPRGDDQQQQQQSVSNDKGKIINDPIEKHISNLKNSIFFNVGYEVLLKKEFVGLMKQLESVGREEIEAITPFTMEISKEDERLLNILQTTQSIYQITKALKPIFAQGNLPYGSSVLKAIIVGSKRENIEIWRKYVKILHPHFIRHLFFNQNIYGPFKTNFDTKFVMLERENPIFAFTNVYMLNEILYWLIKYNEIDLAMQLATLMNEKKIAVLNDSNQIILERILRNDFNNPIHKSLKVGELFQLTNNNNNNSNENINENSEQSTTSQMVIQNYIDKLQINLLKWYQLNRMIEEGHIDKALEQYHQITKRETLSKKHIYIARISMSLYLRTLATTGATIESPSDIVRLRKFMDPIRDDIFYSVVFEWILDNQHVQANGLASKLLDKNINQIISPENVKNSDLILKILKAINMGTEESDNSIVTIFNIYLKHHQNNIQKTKTVYEIFELMRQVQSRVGKPNIAIALSNNAFVLRSSLSQSIIDSISNKMIPFLKGL